MRATGFQIRRARAPGRVNLIGDHTDYTGGLALPMAINLETAIVFEQTNSQTVRMESDHESLPAEIDLHTQPDSDFSRLVPPWGRYVAGVVATTSPSRGGQGHVTTTLPIGAGLSSSAALEVAAALAMGFQGDLTE